jgi:hypothetical protein
MSGDLTNPTTELEIRLKRDGVTISDEERDRLIELTPLAHEWIRKLSIPEARYAEPGLTHRPK